MRHMLEILWAILVTVVFLVVVVLWFVSALLCVVVARILKPIGGTLMKVLRAIYRVIKGGTSGQQTTDWIVGE